MVLIACLFYSFPKSVPCLTEHEQKFETVGYFATFSSDLDS